MLSATGEVRIGSGHGDTRQLLQITGRVQQASHWPSAHQRKRAVETTLFWLMVLNRDLEIARDAPLVRIATKGEQSNRTKAASRRGRPVSVPGSLPQQQGLGVHRQPLPSRAALKNVRALWYSFPTGRRRWRSA